MAGFDFGGKKKNHRRYPGIKGRRPDNKAQRREDVLGDREGNGGRLKAWQKLSHSEQIALLDVRLGKNVGAKKQRARIAKLLEAKPSTDKK